LRLTSHDPSGAGETDKEEKANSRAARANQRRLLRDVAAIGVSFDVLAGREQQLRFDRSSIHAWGVFADEDIKEGEMLVEYRGEIIGNSMAEKREKEYENAKIGSDYMFRIDGLSVCDATKQGNVARFINANCDPNCFTKIISIDGVKRIVVYSKRDILAGEELCYDYKFPLEYDEAQRIPCHCGSRDCRGFMNWVSRRASLCFLL
jgi:histone-lysine N-methyltransferase SETD1